MAKRQSNGAQGRQETQDSDRAPTSTAAKAGVKQETARLKRELAEALERQKATGEILAVISRLDARLAAQSSTPSLRDSAVRLCDATRGLTIYKSYDGQYHMRFDRQHRAQYRPSANGRRHIRCRRGAVRWSGRAALERKTCHLAGRASLIPNMSAAGTISTSANYRSVLGVPLADRDGALLGVIALMRQVEGRSRLPNGRSSW